MAVAQRQAAGPPSRLHRVSRDEDALRWEGDDELDRATPRDTRVAPVVAAPAAPARERGPRAIRWLALALAIAATAGWVVVVVANPVEQPSLIGLALYQLGELLA